MGLNETSSSPINTSEAPKAQILKPKKSSRKPGRQSQSTVSGAQHRISTYEAPEPKVYDPKRTFLGAAGLSAELSRAIEGGSQDDSSGEFLLEDVMTTLGEDSSDAFILEEIEPKEALIPSYSLESQSIVLQMDIESLRHKYSQQIKELQDKYSQIDPLIHDILSLSIQSPQQLPHALLALALLYGFEHEAKEFYTSINVDQKKYSDYFFDREVIIDQTRTKEDTKNLFVEILGNFIDPKEPTQVSYFAY